jgi:isoleucyl-tRNA synthetase
MLPTTDNAKIDDTVVMGMKLLQQTVELGRRAREAANISMKTPVKEVVVVCGAANALAALQGDLEAYVLKELNAWGVSLTNDIDTWCSVSALPNLPVLAKRLGKKTRVATNAIKELDSAALRKYINTDNITIDVEGGAINLVADDLIVKSTFAGNETQYTAITTPDGALTVAICTVQDDVLRRQGIARDLCNRVNKLRKKAKLNIADKVDVFFADLGSTGNDEQSPEQRGTFISTVEALADNKLLLEKAKIVPMPLANCHGQIIMSDINATPFGANFLEVVLAAPVPSLSPAAQRQHRDTTLEGDQSTLNVLEALLATCNLPKDTLRGTLSGRPFNLKVGTDFFPSATAALS